MNWSDLLVLAIIGVFSLIGMSNGFIFSMFRLTSFFIAALIAVKCYPLVSKLMMNTFLYTNIKDSIYKNLLLQQGQGGKIDTHAKKAAADTIVNSLNLPDFLKETIIGQIPSPSKLFDIRIILGKVSELLAGVVIDVISLILLFILIRFGLIFVRFILKGIAKLPVFKQMDKLGGIAFGAIEGLLLLYIIFAVLTIFHSSVQVQGIFDAIDSSTIAKYIYQHNFIVDWMFAGNKII